MMSDEKDFTDDFGDLDDELDDDLDTGLDGESADGEDWDEEFEDWDDESGSFETTDTTVSTKKKSGKGGLFLVLLIIAAGVGGLYFTVFNGGNKTTDNTSGEIAAASQNTAMNATMNNEANGISQMATSLPSDSMGDQMSSLSEFDTNNAPSMPDMSGFGGIDNTASMPPMPNTMVMDSDFSPTPSVEPADLVPMPDFAAMSAPSAPSLDMDMGMDDFAPVMSAPDLVAAPDAPAAISMPAMKMPEPVGASSPVSAPVPTQIKAPTLAPAPVASESESNISSGADTDAVLAKLDGVASQMDQIVNRIAQLERDLSKVKSSNKDVSALSRELKSIKGQMGAVHSSNGQQTQKAPALPKASSVERYQSHAPTKKAAPSGKWVLKGIAQNTAWIAKEGQTDILKVTVGDTVKGLGRVMSIGLENGVWTVRGEDGIVTQ
tara:strand:+ start:371918 stop:373222 length:1305 start_codon:yes stop_codon:yes gene_type:complete